MFYWQLFYPSCILFKLLSFYVLLLLVPEYVWILEDRNQALYYPLHLLNLVLCLVRVKWWIKNWRID